MSPSPQPIASTDEPGVASRIMAYLKTPGETELGLSVWESEGGQLAGLAEAN
jgi:hypothetical protein